MRAGQGRTPGSQRPRCNRTVVDWVVVKCREGRFFWELIDVDIVFLQVFQFLAWIPVCQISRVKLQRAIVFT